MKHCRNTDKYLVTVGWGCLINW